MDEGCPGLRQDDRDFVYINTPTTIKSSEYYYYIGACGMGKSPLGKKYEHGMDADLRYGFVTDSRGIIVEVFDKAHFDERHRTLRKLRRALTGGSK